MSKPKTNELGRFIDQMEVEVLVKEKLEKMIEDNLISSNIFPSAEEIEKATRLCVASPARVVFALDEYVRICASSEVGVWSSIRITYPNGWRADLEKTAEFMAGQVKGALVAQRLMERKKK